MALPPQQNDPPTKPVGPSFNGDMSSINSPVNNFSNFLVSPHEAQNLGLNGKNKFPFQQKSKKSAIKYLDQIDFMCSGEKSKRKEDPVQQHIMNNNYINFQEITRPKDTPELTQLSLLQQENQQLKLQLYQQFSLNQEFQLMFSKMKEDLETMQQQSSAQKEKKQKYKQMSLQYESVATQQNETINELQQKLMHKKLKYREREQISQKQLLEYQLIIQQQNQQLSQNYSSTNFQESQHKEVLKSIEHQGCFISEKAKKLTSPLVAQELSEKVQRRRDDFKRKSVNHVTPSNNVFMANLKNTGKSVSQFTPSQPNANSQKQIELLKQKFKEQQQSREGVHPGQRVHTTQAVKENLKKNFKDFLLTQKSKASPHPTPQARQSLVQFNPPPDKEALRNSSLEFKKYFQQKYQQEKRNTVYN